MHFPFGLGTHIEARDTDISEHELVSRLLQLHDRSHGQDAEFVCERYDYIRRKTSRAGFYAKLLHNSELQTALQTVTEAEVAVAEQYYNDVRAAKRAGGALPAKSVFVNACDKPAATRGRLVLFTRHGCNHRPAFTASVQLLFDSIHSQGQLSSHGSEPWALYERNKLFAMQRFKGNFHM